MPFLAAALLSYLPLNRLGNERPERVERVSSREGEADARLSQAGERQLTFTLRLHRLPSANDR